MASSPLHIRTLRSGGLITNYDCQSTCGHCLYRCGPHRGDDYVDEGQLNLLLQTLKRMRCRAVHIGGGEPFARPEELKRVVSQVLAAGVGIDYVETNSQWFVDDDQAEALLAELADLGLGSLLVSVSPFHNGSVTLTQILGVIRACQRTGLHPFVWVPGFLDDLARFDPDTTHRLSEYESTFGRDYLRRLPGRYWIHQGGRALATFRRWLPTQTLTEVLADSPGGCGELAHTDHFHLDLRGNYVPGLCAGLAIRAADLGAPLDPDDYPLLSLLWRDGISGLHAWAVAEHCFEPRGRGYLSKCDLCDHIRRHLVRNAGLASHELQPTGFYDNNPAPADAAAGERR